MNSLNSRPALCSRRLRRRDRGHVDEAARGDRGRQQVRGLGGADEDRADRRQSAVTRARAASDSAVSAAIASQAKATPGE